KVRLEDRVEALKNRVYHDKLGSMYDRTKRVENIAWAIAPQVRIADLTVSGVGVRQYDAAVQNRAQRAAALAKADLSTGMVSEFPELQGVMGGYYYQFQHAAEDHDINQRIENAAISVAISAHYKPVGPSDTCPVAPESVVLALADKVETLCGFFRI